MLAKCFMLEGFIDDGLSCRSNFKINLVAFSCLFGNIDIIDWWHVYDFHVLIIQR